MLFVDDPAHDSCEYDPKARPDGVHHPERDGSEAEREQVEGSTVADDDDHAAVAETPMLSTEKTATTLKKKL